MSKKGFNQVRYMRGRKDKGGNDSPSDGFNRTHLDTLACHIDRWIERLEQKNYSPRTLDMNRKALVHFVTWAEERDLLKPSQFTKPHLESYQRHLWRWKKADGKALSVRTQRQRLGAIQRLFAHLAKDNEILANPASDLDLPKKPHRLLPKGLSKDEIKALMNVPDVTDLLGIRDRAILELLYATAIRRSELVGIDLEDIDLASQRLQVTGKGDKTRIVPMSSRAVFWLKRYLSETRPRLQLDHTVQALWLSGYGERISGGYIGKWMKKIMLEAGIHKDGALHLLRHTCATHMLENGCDIRFIQQLLGHSSLDTTSVYTQVAIAQLQSVYEKTHPSHQEKS